MQILATLALATWYIHVYTILYKYTCMYVHTRSITWICGTIRNGSHLVFTLKLTHLDAQYHSTQALIKKLICRNHQIITTLPKVPATELEIRILKCVDIMSVHDQFCSDNFKFCTGISDSVLPFHELIHELIHELQLYLQTRQIPQTAKHDPGLTDRGY